MPAPKDPAKYKLFCQRVGERSRGRKLTPEQKARQGAAISAAKTGKPRPDMRGDGNPMRRPEIVAKLTGKRNPKYVAVPGYFGVHDRLEAARGLAATYLCIACTRPAKQWALKHECATHAEPSKSGKKPYVYSLDPWDYMPLCVSCHKRYDLGRLTL